MDFISRTQAGRAPSFHRWTIWMCGLLALAFAFKTFASLQMTSLWFDELASAGKSFQPSLKLIIGKLQNDVHPPFYYVALWIAGQLFGKTATVLRGFSLFFYLLTACLLAFACWSWGRSRLAAVLAALFATALPFSIRYAVEGKGYTLLVFMICLATLCRLRLLRGQFSLATPCALFWSAAALTHYYGMGLLLIQALLDWRRGLPSWRPLAWALVLPSLWMALNLQFLLGTGGRDWIPPAGPWLLLDSLSLALGHRWLVCLALFAALAWLVSRRSIGMNLSMTTFAVDWGLDAGLLLLVLTALISAVRPSAFPRYYIVLVPACLGVCACWLGAVLEAYPTAGWRRPWMEMALLVAVLGIFWTSGYEPINPPAETVATRDGSDFRSLSLMAAHAPLKYTTAFQCPALNSYDELLRQEHLSSARSSWHCLPQFTAGDTPSFNRVIGARPSHTLLIGSARLPWRLQLEGEHLSAFREHLMRLGYRCHLDPLSTRAARLETCQLVKS